jgi:hypothetical protein
MPYGYRFQIGMQRVTQPDPNARHGGRWAGVVIVALAFAVIAMLVWPAARPAESAPAAHIAPAPAAPTVTAKPAPSPVILHVTPQTGAICILPNGKTTGPVELAEVP